MKVTFLFLLSLILGQLFTPQTIMPVLPIAGDGVQQEPEKIPDSHIKQFAGITESSTLEDLASQESRLIDSSYAPHDDSSFLTTSSGEGSWGDSFGLPWRGLGEDDFVHDGDSMELVVGVDGGGFSIASVGGSVFDIISKYNGKVINTVSRGGFSIASGSNLLAYVVNVSIEDVTAFTEEAQGFPSVKYVEPNYRYKIAAVPNDPDYSLQWGLQKIEAEKAWDIQTGSKDIIVAVIDTGIDYDHPDLAANYVPLGYDWVNNDDDPMDDNGHGTHVSGIIAAVSNNSIGMSGIAQVSVMAEKGLDETGYGDNDDLANCLLHALTQKANIICASWGSYRFSLLLYDAIHYAVTQNVLVISAAGNDASTVEYYPAAFNDVIAVSATDKNENPADFTNYGSWIDLAAPGVDIYSTTWDNTYTNMSGTSMATPFVAGVAALTWSHFPDFTQNEIREKIELAADDLGSSGYDVFYGHGRVNVEKATRPPAIHDIKVELDISPIVKPKTNTSLQITLYNNGLVTETNISVTILINLREIQTFHLSELTSRNSTVITYLWKPDEGRYNITIIVTPVDGETLIRDNQAYSIVYVSNSPNISSDIIVEGHTILTIEDCNLSLRGNIIIRDNAKLFLSNMTIILNQTTHFQYEIQVTDQGQLFTEKVIFFSDKSFKEVVSGFSRVYINNTKFQYSNYLYTHSFSQVMILNSRLQYIYGKGNSTIKFIKSTLGTFYCYDYSIISINESVVQGDITFPVTTTCTISGSNVHISNSTIGKPILTFGGAASISLTDLTIGKYKFWNIYLNETVDNIFYNLTLINTTIIYGWQIDNWYSVNTSIKNSHIQTIFGGIVPGSPYIHGDSVVVIYNSTIWDLRANGNSTFIIYDSNISKVACIHNANVTIKNSILDVFLQLKDSGRLVIDNSVIYTMKLFYHEFSNISFSNFDYRTDKYLILITHRPSGDLFSNVTFTDTEIHEWNR